MNKSVNLFFSCDDGYVPFMAVALTSIKMNCDTSREYNIYVLHTGISQENIQKITSSISSDGFRVSFCDISHKVDEFSRKLHTRDYYSKSTYYRLFIPELFPTLDKALYLDGDIAVIGDISKLYDTELYDNLAGAVPDSCVTAISEFSAYVKNRLDVEPEKYFNAGILLMNLKKMREIGFEEMFLNLIDAVKFNVAQDQDYLNVICKDRTLILSRDWNTMPFGERSSTAKLIHYNLDAKPWHKKGVMYEEIFWYYADCTVFDKEIYKAFENYTPDKQKKAAMQTANLINTAHAQALNTDENILIQQSINVICRGVNKYGEKRTNRESQRQTCRT